MSLLYRFICFVCLVTLLIACEDCGPTDEPELRLYVTNDKLFRIDTVYAVGAINALRVGERIQKYTGTYGTLMLPLSLHADSTRYKLRLNGRIETIMVFYRRDFSYKSRKCGYVINLYGPINGRQPTSNIGRVGSVDYRQDKYGTGSFLSSKYPTGSDLMLNL